MKIGTQDFDIDDLDLTEHVVVRQYGGVLELRGPDGRVRAYMSRQLKARRDPRLDWPAQPAAGVRQ